MQNPQSKAKSVPLRASERKIISDVTDRLRWGAELAGRAAIVTGSTSGIGFGVARALAASGSAVVLNGFGRSLEAILPKVDFVSIHCPPDPCTATPSATRRPTPC